MSINTLIGKENILFLSGKEIEIHCNNLNTISDITLSNYTFDKFFIVIFPDKSVYYKNFLPDGYKSIYRPSLDIYKSKFNNKCLDAYEILKNEDNAYYKTDSHINFKGSYKVYLEFIERVNKIYNLNIKAKEINLSIIKNINLSELGRGIGDLTWVNNLGDIKLTNINDDYYYSNDIIDFYTRYKIIEDGNLRFLDYQLNDKTNDLVGTVVNWDIISNYIIYIKKIDISNRSKIIIFYDSFLLVSLSLYFDLFYEVWFIKNVYDNNLIKEINPGFVFEFRVERFLL
jgi:hypothetical protein